MKYSNQSDDFYERPAIGRFFFFPKGPKGALTHHLQADGGIPPVGQARALFTKRLLAAFPEGAGNVASEHSLCSRLYICSISKTMRWHIATPSRRLPAKTCHWQLLRSYGYRILGDTHFLFSKEKQKERTVKPNGNLSSGSKSS